MPRKLNATYIFKMMDRERLFRNDATVFLGGWFGFSYMNDGLLTHPDWGKNPTFVQEFWRDVDSYKGWSLAGKIFCRRCWTPHVGVPKEIVRRNWCDTCQRKVYDDSDHEWLDLVGFSLYRFRVTRFTGYAVREYLPLIDGFEKIKKTKRYHKDHIYSVRDGFEHEIDERVIASPVNIRVITIKKNLAKQRSSDVTANELLERYQKFAGKHPDWEALIAKRDCITSSEGETYRRPAKRD